MFPKINMAQISPKCILPANNSSIPKQRAIKIGPERSGSYITLSLGLVSFNIILIRLLIISGYIPISNIIFIIYPKEEVDLHFNQIRKLYRSLVQNRVWEFVHYKQAELLFSWVVNLLVELYIKFIWALQSYLVFLEVIFKFSKD